MFLPLYRTTGRVCVRLGLKIGDETVAAFRRLRAATVLLVSVTPLECKRATKHVLYGPHSSRSFIRSTN